MLSDEERKAIDYLQLCYDLSTITNESLSKLGIVLNLIEKQSKEIEEWRKKYRQLQSFYYGDYIHKDKNKQLQSFYYGDYIHKDKIKAKILECREILYSFEKELELKANKDKFIHKESMNCLLGQISILQSLLEKE